MNNTDLQILVQLKDEASAEFKSMGNNMVKTSADVSKSVSILQTDVTGLSKTLLAGAAAAGGLAIAFGVSAVKDYMKSEAGLASITATLKSMGQAALDNKDALLKAASAAVKMGFDDDDAAASITRFYQATGSLTQAQKLNNLAMDLARAKNLDLATAAGLVNQVLSGNGRALKQYQINLKDSATPLEALAELQGKVAGQATAFTGTLSGQIEVITNTWSNMKKAIGQVLTEALTPFVKQFSGWLNDPKTQEQFAVWTENLKSWADVIIPTIVELMKIWFDTLNNIFNIMLKIGDAINSALSAFQSLSKKLDQSFAGQVINQPGGILGGAVSEVKHLFGINDGIVQNGNIITTHPDDYIIATKTPGALGGGLVVSISGNSFYGSDSEFAEKIGNQISKIIGQNVKLRTI